MKNILFVEIIVTLLFILTLFFIRKDKFKIKILTLAFIFAIIFENLNIILSKNTVGGYFYNSEFIVFIFHTPLFVILAWSLIILSAILISNKLPSTPKNGFNVSILIFIKIN